MKYEELNHAGWDLLDYISNDRVLYDRKRYMETRLATLRSRGQYDHAKAPKMFRPLVDDAAKQAFREGERGELGSPSPAMKAAFAQELADRFLSDNKSGEHKTMIPKLSPRLKAKVKERRATVKASKVIVSDSYLRTHKFSVAEIKRMPTLESGHMDNLIAQTPGTRIWVSRMTTEDGMPYNNQVTVEALSKGSWVTIKVYRPGSGGAGRTSSTKKSPTTALVNKFLNGR